MPKRRDWITASEAARRTGFDPATIRDAMAQGGVRTLKLPGRRPLYHAGDLAALMRASVTRPASFANPA